jgi:hypothetical protein
MNLAATVNVVLYDRMAKMMANQEVSGAGTGGDRLPGSASCDSEKG